MENEIFQVGKERLRDLIAMETVINLNEAFCEHHRKHCKPAITTDTAVIIRQCEEVAKAAAEVRDEYYRIGNVPDGEAGALCGNEAGDDQCNRWASEGACNGNAGATPCLSSVVSTSMCDELHFAHNQTILHDMSPTVT